ncbi:MAG: amino acid permease [Candidatus Delongbacteria bacterium]|nr:amino acid permease [Candidatus Delongbacteria bacterium]
MTDKIIAGPIKFGTFRGVFVPSTEGILGTVLFLLLPVLTADLGLIRMLMIVVLAHTVTFATMFSISDIATNLNTIGGGGMYALIKRSLGSAMGGAIGIQLFIAQAASIGFYSIGFAEPLYPILNPFLQKISFLSGSAPEDILFQKQILSSIIFLVFFTVVMFGADFTLKVQTFILFVLGASILAIFLCPAFSFEFEGKQLFRGLDQINFSGNRNITLGIFFIAFAQFFPAVTGVDAGVGMSGDLKDPKVSLVKGTFYAITITFVVYLATTFVFSLMNKDLLITGYTKNGDAAGYLLPDILSAAKGFPSNIFSVTILVGILFATGSSALSVFMTAPRTLQSLTRDKVLPRIMDIFARDFKKDGNEPRFAILLSFILGFGVIWMGDISMAAMIVGICFLVVYGMLNGAAFLERISGNPSFRPTSRGHWSISLYGFLISMIIITLFSWWVGLIVLFTQFMIFRLILKYKTGGRLEGVWWGVIFIFITKGLKTLNKIVQGTKNWRPIVTSIGFSERPDGAANIKFLSDILLSYKSLVNMNVLKRYSEDESGLNIIDEETDLPFKDVEVKDPTLALLSILQISYLGGLTSNTIMFDYNPNVDNVKIFNRILSLKKNILLLHSRGRFYEEDIHSIDIWWRGEKNGNLMVLISYIINAALKLKTGKEVNLRIIRKIGPEENENEARLEMEELLKKARLFGEVLILPFSKELFTDTIKTVSADAGMVIIGLPGQFVMNDDKKEFKFDKNFIEKGLAGYTELPPVLLVKSSMEFELFDE